MTHTYSAELERLLADQSFAEMNRDALMGNAD
jgi:hypothetical protein